MKKVFCVLAAALLITGIMAACSEQDGSTPASVKKAGELVIATSPDYPPFEYIAGSDIVGIDMDIAKAIADDLGVKLRIDAMDFDGVLASIATGKCDLGISALSVRPDRLESMDFSDTYFDSTVKILVPVDSGVASSADLNGKTVAVQLGTIAGVVAEELGATVVNVKTNSECILELKAGRVDAVMTDKGPAEVFARNEAGSIIMLDEDLASDDIYAIATKKGNTELIEQVNKTIKRLIDEGKIEEFIEKHKDAE